MKLGKRKCKNCGDVFQKERPLQSVCGFNCANELVKTKQKKDSATAWKAKKARVKESLKTLGDYKKDLQYYFNRWIRLTKEKVCISCDKNLEGTKYDASHYRSVGSNPSLRYEPDNVWNGCVRCNRDLHGNLIEYRKRLLIKIGKERLDFLEQEQPPKKYTIDEIKELIKLYKLKLKEIESYI